MSKTYPSSGRRRVIIISIIISVLLAGTVLIFSLSTRHRKNRQQVQNTTPLSRVQELWYKHAVVYTLDVEVFYDSDGDGTGDFRGLIQKLGYLDSLGVDVIWLAPFQPTPNQDDGYDITDFNSVDPRLGTMADFKSFMAAAKKRGLKIIMDLVANHTSSQHPWFRQARANAQSPYRQWYVWSASKPANYDQGMVFPGVQKDIWTYDTLARAYYYHRFYDFQPDLNTQLPAVQTALKKTIKFWMDNGISGFRLDAVPFYIEVPETKGKKFERQYEMLTDMHHYLYSLDSGAIILGEANVLPGENKNYFGEHGEKMNMMFNFYVNQYLFYALATSRTHGLREALNKTHDIPVPAQWGQFLRNHDEVDLGRLSRRQRREVYAAFGPDSNMQLYDRGIRRRLAPMLGNDRKRLEMAYSLLFSLPSTPVIRYGDEIGMGDDLTQKERMSVRSPMQWTNSANAGFSSAKQIVRPLIDDSVYGYRQVNVAAQLGNDSSLLQWTRQMIRLRKACPEISFGSWEIIDAGSPYLLAIRYRWQNSVVLVIHNFDRQPRRASFSGMPGKALLNLINRSSTNIRNEKADLLLSGYGYQWFRIL